MPTEAELERQKVEEAGLNDSSIVPAKPPSPAGSVRSRSSRGSVGSNASGRRTKTLLVRRPMSGVSKGPPLSGMTTALEAPSPSKSGKRVLLARKTAPGKTIQLTEDSGMAKIRVPKLEQDDEFIKNVVPVSVLTSGFAGPKRDNKGKIVPRTILGDTDEYEMMQQAEFGGSTGSMSPTREDLSTAQAKAAGLDSTGQSLRREVATPSEAGTTKIGRRKKEPVVVDQYRQKLMAQEQLKNSLIALKHRQQEENTKRKVKLEQLLVHERLQLTRDERALERHDKMQVEWERFSKRMAHRLKKDVDDLVFNRMDEAREKKEEYEKVNQATPVHMRFGPDNWEMSLRDAYCKYAQIGGPLSGLYAPVMGDNQKADLEIIRNPIMEQRRKNRTQAVDYKPPKDWKNSEAFITRKQRLKRNLENLYPHQPTLESMQVGGTAMLTVEKVKGQFNITDDVVIDLNSENPADLEALAAQMAADAEKVEEVEEVKVEQTGPQIETTDQTMIFNVYSGEVEKKTFTVTNTGSTAIYYAWEHVPHESIVEQSFGPEQRNFFQFDLEGVILPTQSKTFHFLFKSNVPGVFQSEYEFRTKPYLRTEFPRVHLRGTALEDDYNILSRKRLEEQLDRNQAVHIVQDILYDIVEHEVRAPEVEYEPIVEINVTEEMFNTINAGTNVYYVASTYPQFVALADKAFEALNFPVDDRRWDASVESLQELIQDIPDEGTRSLYVEEVNKLIRLSSVKPKVDSLVYSIGYELLVEFCDEIDVLADLSKIQAGLMKDPNAIFKPAEETPAEPAKAAGGKTRAKATPAAAADAPAADEAVELTEEEREKATADYRHKLEMQVFNLLGETMERFDMLCAEGSNRAEMLALDEQS
eukprot:GFYU01007501.1.p1 GENE.GFYU01007501.1~~GFYU01007501.1.p1  ORF type:complete len:870 (-),score=308.69 GFYU01007501.1:334-2943(-)